MLRPQECSSQPLASARVAFWLKLVGEHVQCHSYQVSPWPPEHFGASFDYKKHVPTMVDVLLAKPRLLLQGNTYLCFVKVLSILYNKMFEPSSSTPSGTLFKVSM